MGEIDNAAAGDNDFDPSPGDPNRFFAFAFSDADNGSCPTRRQFPTRTPP